MRRATITFPDEIEQALDAYTASLDAPPTLTAITQAAVREYLAERGFLRSRRVLRIRPAEPGGDPRASIEHDRHVADMNR
ncbi:MAG: hypothetical protein ACRD1H_11275 [Vicinamibacterales bacterium]